jgi:hypothetical protein
MVNQIQFSRYLLVPRQLLLLRRFLARFCQARFKPQKSTSTVCLLIREHFCWKSLFYSSSVSTSLQIDSQHNYCWISLDSTHHNGSLRSFCLPRKWNFNDPPRTFHHFVLQLITSPNEWIDGYGRIFRMRSFSWSFGASCFLRPVTSLRVSGRKVKINTWRCRRLCNVFMLRWKKWRKKLSEDKNN